MVDGQGLRLKDYLGCVAALRPLSDWELQAAWEAWERGDLTGRRLIEERFLHKVVAWSQPYRGAGLRFSALIEEGNRALLKALRLRSVARAPDLEDHLRRCVESAIEAKLMVRRAQ